MRKTSGHGYEMCGTNPRRGPESATRSQREREHQAFRAFQERHGATDAKARHYGRKMRSILLSASSPWPVMEDEC